MKQILATLIFLLAVTGSQAQEKKLYDPSENAEKEIEYALSVARSKNKHVLIQAGGNWCKWCIEFNRFSKADSGVNAIIEKNYVVYHLNWSPENENKKVFAKYGFPQRFGFPVFLVLDGKGNLLHTQNSAYLEEGKGYNKPVVVEFFQQWSPSALDPANYKEQ